MWIILILVVILLIAFLFVRLYVKLLRLRKQRESSFKIIDGLLEKKHDLIPAYVESIKQFVKDQKEIIISIAESRTSAMAATVINDKILAEQQLSRSVLSFEERSPLYPELKADPSYVKVKNDLMAIDKDLELAKQVFNSRTNEYNQTIRTFPASVIATNFNFAKELLFEDEPEFL